MLALLLITFACQACKDEKLAFKRQHCLGLSQLATSVESELEGGALADLKAATATDKQESREQRCANSMRSFATAEGYVRGFAAGHLGVSVLMSEGSNRQVSSGPVIVDVHRAFESLLRCAEAPQEAAAEVRRVLDDLKAQVEKQTASCPAP